MKKSLREKLSPYGLVIMMYMIFMVAAFMIDTPKEIAKGFVLIVKSRSILVTDYMEVGGIGATLLNAVIVGGASIGLLIRSKVKPNGSTFMALFLTTGFAFFGKNIFNMIPITFGVWLYAKKQGEPFLNYSLVALLSATISPIVSELSYLEIWKGPMNMIFGISVGILAGFLFPMVSAFTVRVHDGYVLYNLGFAGGLISTFLVSLLKIRGIDVETVTIWSSGNNLFLGCLFYFIFLMVIIYGLIKGNRKKVFHHLKIIMRHSGRLVADFYTQFGENAFINMGILGILGVTVVLLLGGDLNGPTLSGILTMAGFGCFGKHLRNVIPVMVGAFLGTIVNLGDVTSPGNILAILFCTGLAPIAGQFGVIWGIVAGFLHVNFTAHIGVVNQGMNLYNNGFGAGFVALLLVPVITGLRNHKGERK